MIKVVNRFFSIIFVSLMLISILPTVHAVQPEDNSVSPMYAVSIDVACHRYLSSDNTLHISCDYGAAYDSGVTRVDITVFVEKRNLLVFWERVDINQPNDEWTTICYGLENDVAHAVSITSGTYRVTSIFEVYCGRDLVETIENTTDSFTC